VNKIHAKQSQYKYGRTVITGRVLTSVQIHLSNFLWAIALFAGLLTAYFVTYDISTKKKLIGVLRAGGASKANLYMIFGFGAFVMGLINFGISLLLSVILNAFFENFFRLGLGLNIRVLSLNSQVVLALFALSVGWQILITLLALLKIMRRPLLVTINE